jgi:NAD(P)-dependent dehydrogenase (short-subunit alcohol dehydrogenase family)
MKPGARLDGRIVVITGAARGLGRVLADGLSQEGARVVLADLDGEGARRGAEEIAATGEALAVEADCATSAGIRTVLDAVEGSWGAPADALVNNAGVLSHGDLLTVEEAEIERVLHVNTVGPMLATREFAARLVATGTPGAVVNITSSTAHVASLPGLSTYAASKGALLAFTRGAATDLARKGIRVNAVSPGWMRTDMSRDLDRADDDGGGLRRRIPMGRPAEPTEMVDAVAFLLSDGAGYVTGTYLAVDGGWLAY